MPLSLVNMKKKAPKNVIKNAPIQSKCLQQIQINDYNFQV